MICRKYFYLSIEKTTVVFELIITMSHQTISLGSWSKYGILDVLPVFTMSAAGHYFRI